MKNFVVAAAFAVFGTSVFAGSYGKDDVIIEQQPLVVAETVEQAAQSSSSGAGLVIPLMFLVVVGSIAAGN